MELQIRRITFTVFSLLFLLSAEVYSMPYPNKFKDLNEYYGINYQYLTLSDELNSGETNLYVGSHAHAVGFIYSYMPRSYFRMSLGSDLVYMSDKAPFEETVSDSSGNTKTLRSNIFGYSLYLEGGFSKQMMRWRPLSIGSTVGFRRNDIRRGVFNCSGCVSQKLDEIPSSFYVKPFIEYQLQNGMLAQFYTVFYAKEPGYEQGVGIQFSLPIL